MNQISFLFCVVKLLLSIESATSKKSGYVVLKAIQIENYAQSYIGFYSSMPTWFLHLHSLGDTFNNEYFSLFLAIKAQMLWWKCANMQAMAILLQE